MLLPVLLGGCVHLGGKPDGAGEDAGKPTVSAQEKAKPTRRPAEPATYDEAVSSVLVTQDQQKLAVIGADHHFVFQMPKGIASALKASFRRVISVEFGEFRVHADGVVTGNYQLLLSRDATAQHYNAASAIGFAELGSGDHMRMLGRLYGVRYFVEGGTAPVSRAKAGSPYRVKVINETSGGETAGKVTPVTATADGGLAIASTPLVAIGLPVAASNCASKKCAAGG